MLPPGMSSPACCHIAVSTISRCQGCHSTSTCLPASISLFSGPSPRQQWTVNMWIMRAITVTVQVQYSSLVLTSILWCINYIYYSKFKCWSNLLKHPLSFRDDHSLSVKVYPNWKHKVCPNWRPLLWSGYQQQYRWRRKTCGAIFSLPGSSRYQYRCPLPCSTPCQSSYLCPEPRCPHLHIVLTLAHVNTSFTVCQSSVPSHVTI